MPCNTFHSPRKPPKTINHSALFHRLGQCLSEDLVRCSSCLQTRPRLWRVAPEDPPTCHQDTGGPRAPAAGWDTHRGFSGGHTLRRAAPRTGREGGVGAGCSPQDSWLSGFGAGPSGLWGTSQEHMAARTFPPGRPPCASAHRPVPLHLAARLGVWKTWTKTSSSRNTTSPQAGRHCHPHCG